MFDFFGFCAELCHCVYVWVCVNRSEQVEGSPCSSGRAVAVQPDSCWTRQHAGLQLLSEWQLLRLVWQHSTRENIKDFSLLHMKSVWFS